MTKDIYLFSCPIHYYNNHRNNDNTYAITILNDTICKHINYNKNKKETTSLIGL